MDAFHNHLADKYGETASTVGTKTFISHSDCEADAKILAEFGESLAEIFIVSSAKVTAGKFETIAVRADKAEGERCVRCWRVVRNLDSDSLCPRCREAMAETK